MNVRIKKNHDFPIEYKTKGACGFDFYAVEETKFEPKEFALIETGTVIEVPEGYVLMAMPRSSTFKNYGLMQVNSVGIIDQDYCGNNDTIKFPYMNMRDESVIVPKWERIGQGVLVKIARAEFEEVEDMENEDRWGFGTTGKR